MFGGHKASNEGEEQHERHQNKGQQAVNGTDDFAELEGSDALESFFHNDLRKVATMPTTGLHVFATLISRTESIFHPRGCEKFFGRSLTPPF